jgi:hypothetical protein
MRKEYRLRAFKNRMLSRICGHIEKLHDLYSSPSIIWVIISIKSRRWARHVACMGKKRGYTWFWWGNLMKGDHLVGGCIEGRIII